MKALIFILAVFSVSASATPWSAKVCADRLKDHELLVDYTLGRFNAGEVTRKDVAITELGFEVAKFECGKTSRSEYCRAALRAVTTYVNGVNEDARVGQATVEDQVEARLRLYKVRNECE